MLTYQFSTREKTLIIVLVVIVLAVAWYMLVFQNTQSQITSIESQIAEAESNIQIDQARVAQLDSMNAAIEEHKAAGDEPAAIPDYDNLQPLMAELNRIMGMTDTYSLSFDDVDLDSGEFVRRGVRIDFSCGSYQDAKAVVNALADGAFPCSIDTVAISDNASARRSGSGGASASVQVTFFEKR